MTSPHQAGAATGKPGRTPAHALRFSLALFALAAALPFFVLTIYVVQRLVADEFDNATAELARVARGNANDAQTFVALTRHKLLALAREVNAEDPQGRRCGPLLGNIVAFNPDYANAFTTDADGRVVCSAIEIPLGSRLDADLVGKVAQARGLVLGEPVRGFATGRWVVYALVPIERGDKLAGIAGISLDLVAMARLLNSAALPAGASSAFATRSGLIVTRQPETDAFVGRELRNPILIAAMREPNPGTARGPSVRGDERIWSFQPIAGTPWVSMSGLPTAVVLEPPRRRAAGIVGLSALITLLVVLMSLVMARRIASPIETIAAKARRMARDDDERIVPTGPREVREVGEELNRVLDARLAIERELRESGHQLRLVTDHLPGLVARLDEQGRYGFASEGYRRLLGIDPAAMIGRRPADFFDRGAVDRAEGARQRAMAGETVHFENELLAQDGKVVRVMADFVPDFRDGRMRGIYIFAADVTSRHAAEKRLADERALLQSVVASAMTGIIGLDARFHVNIFNPAAEEMFGVEAADMVGLPIDRLLPARFRGTHEASIARFGETGVSSRPMGTGVLMGLRANGEEFPVEATISQAIVGGEMVYTAILRDVTERVRAEQAVRTLAQDLERRVAERTAELEAANRELEAFDYSISHDLRAPLARIQGFATAIRDTDEAALSETSRHYLSRIVATGEVMDELVNDFMNLSMVTRSDLVRTDVDISAIADAIAAELRQGAPERRVEFAIAPGLRTSADARLVRIVLQNLLANAFKFTAKRERGRVEVGSGRSEHGPAFYVADNGVGFDDTQATRIFEPFRRLHSRDEFPGSGVGLATVHRIVRRHGGRAWARGRPGEGATIYFSFAG